MLYKNPDDGHSNTPHLTSTAVQVGLVNLLRSWGIHPRAVVGHSSGEVAAAFTAGILSLRSCIAVSYHRGRLIEKLKAISTDTKGAMIAVGGSEQDVTSMLGSLTSGSAVIGCWNSPSSFTVSGDEPAIVEMKTRLDKVGIFNRRLDIEVAYHSPYMNPIADEYQKSLVEDVVSLDLNIPYYSSAKGNLLQSPKLDATYWTEHMVGPVQFNRAMQQIFTNKGKYHEEINCVIEIGPHSALRAPIKQILESLGLQGKFSYFPTLARGKDAMEMMTSLAAGLFKDGSSFSLSAVNFPGDEAVDSSDEFLTDLPTYPWTHAEYWHESRLSRDRRLRLYPNNELLGHTTLDFNSNEPRWRSIVNITSIPWLEHYRVNSQVVLPLSCCLSMAIEAIHQYLVSKSQSPAYYYLRDVFMKETITFDQSDTELQFTLRTYSTSALETSEQWKEFTISTWTEKSGWTENCRGLVSADVDHQRYDDIASSLSDKSSIIAAANEKAISLDIAEIYRTTENYGVEFGTAFKRLESVESSKSVSTVTTASLDVNMYAGEEYVIHPLTLEGWLQACLPAASVTGKGHSVDCLPVLIKEMIVNPRPEEFGSSQLRIKAFSGEFHPAANEFESSILVESQNTGRSAAAIQGLRLRRPPLRSLEPTKLCFREKWDISLELNTSDRLKDALAVHADSSIERGQIRKLNNVSRHFVHKAVYELDNISQGALQFPEGRCAELYGWMKRQVQKDFANIEVNGDKYLTKDPYIIDDKSVFEVASSGAPGAFISKIGEKLPQIALGEVEPLELMLEDNLLSRNYEEDIWMDCRSYPSLANYVRLLAHQNPRMHILEIGAGTGGATRKILESLGGHENHPACFERYDYTDISAGFFPWAKEKFHQWKRFMNYKKLDIEKHPTSQGFQEHSYDLVIAVNVLHATAIMQHTLQNVRSLLKHNGKLALIEFDSPGYTLFPFATLPSWWLGEGNF
jgi:acyl transferase domain-containing protein/phospholipid N-methyltransferase